MTTTNDRSLSEAETRIRDRHLDYFMELAATHTDEVDSLSPDAPVDILWQEIDNFRAALRWAIDRRRLSDGLRLACDLCPLWEAKHVHSERRSWLEHLLALSMDEPAELRAEASLALATGCQEAGWFDPALRHVSDAIALADGAGTRSALNRARVIKGWTLWATGDLESAKETFEQVVADLRADPEADPATFEYGLRGLGWTCLRLGDNDRAVALHEEGEAILRGAGMWTRLSVHLVVQANLHQHLDDWARVQRLFVDAIDVMREHGPLLYLPGTVGKLADAYMRTSDFDLAGERFEEELQLGREADDQEALADAYGGLAAIAMTRGDRSLARSLWLDALDALHRIADPTREHLAQRAAVELDLSRFHAVEGDLTTARRHFDNAISFIRDDRWALHRGSDLSTSAHLAKQIAPDLHDDLLGEAIAFRESTGRPEDAHIARLLRASVLARTDEEAAVSALTDALEDAERDQQRHLIGAANWNLAVRHHEAGRIAEALVCVERDFEIPMEGSAQTEPWRMLGVLRAAIGESDAAAQAFAEVGPRWGTFLPRELAELVDATAKIAAAREEHAEALRRLAAADAYRDITNQQRRPHEREAVDALRDQLLAELGPQAAAAARRGSEEGAVATLERLLTRGEL